ncbi:hypothetical protein ACT4US_34985, partial [Bacillus sp. HC-Mk]
MKDGKKKVSFTLTNSSWITKFETEKDIMEVKQVKDVSHVITTNNTMETMD